MAQASYYLANTGNSIGNRMQMQGQLHNLTFSTIIKKIGNINYRTVG